VTFWYGFGSGDPYLWLMDPDPTPVPATDPGIFISDLLLLTYYAVFPSFFKDKKSKISWKTLGINVFLTIFA
jgi:hypothetical protein